VDVIVGVDVTVGVGVFVGVSVAVGVRVTVGVCVDVDVIVGVGVAVARRDASDVELHAGRRRPTRLSNKSLSAYFRASIKSSHQWIHSKAHYGHIAMKREG
jgi:tetrahydrodipicolinate N-succinyltransferase